MTIKFLSVFAVRSAVLLSFHTIYNKSLSFSLTAVRRETGRRMREGGGGEEKEMEQTGRKGGKVREGKEEKKRR